MITALIILSGLPLYQMAFSKQTGDVDKLRCTFYITYTPDSGPVDLKKSKIVCKSKKSISVEDYELISEDPTQPCNFTLTFKVSKTRGKLTKASVVCVPPNTISLPPSPTPSPSPSPSPSPAMNEELAKMDAALGSPVTISCYQCLRENAPQCIPLCFPFPWLKECISCVVMFAPQCLGPCGLPTAADKYDKILDNTCEAVPEFDPFRCVVTKNNCDPGFVPVPLPIFGIRFGCACKCELVPE